MPLLMDAFSMRLTAPSAPSHPPRLLRGGLPPIPLAHSLTLVIPPYHPCSLSSVLVNLSRGAVVDEVALADELRREQNDDAGVRRVWGAASDVFVVEPIR